MKNHFGWKELEITNVPKRASSLIGYNIKMFIVLLAHKIVSKELIIPSYYEQSYIIRCTHRSDMKLIQSTYPSKYSFSDKRYSLKKKN